MALHGKHIAASSKNRGFAERVRALREKDECLASWLLFLIPLGFVIAWRILGYTAYSLAWKGIITTDVVHVAVFAILLVRELLFGRYDARAIAGLALFAILFAIAHNANYPLLEEGLVFIFAARDLRFLPIAKFVFIEFGILLLVIFLSALLGAIPDVLYPATRLRGERHSLGFSHPNTAAVYVLYASFLWTYIRGERFGLPDAGVILVLMAVVFSFTDSRASLLIAVAFIVLMLVFRYAPQRVRSPRVLLVFGVGAFLAIVVAGVSLTVGFSPDNPWMRDLDALMSSRLSQGHAALEEWGISLMGQNVPLGSGAHLDYETGEWVSGNGHPIVDNAFVRLLVRLGVVFFLAMMALWLWTTVNAAWRGDWTLVVILMVILAHGLVESAIISIHMDAFLLLLAAPFGVRGRLNAHKEPTHPSMSQL